MAKYIKSLRVSGEVSLEKKLLNHLINKGARPLRCSLPVTPYETASFLYLDGCTIMITETHQRAERTYFHTFVTLLSETEPSELVRDLQETYNVDGIQSNGTEELRDSYRLK